MKELQGDLAARTVHGSCDVAQLSLFVRIVDEAVIPACGARATHRGPAGDDHRRTTRDSLDIERPQGLRIGLQSKVHGSHEYTMRQLQRADPARAECVLERHGQSSAIGFGKAL